MLKNMVMGWSISSQLIVDEAKNLGLGIEIINSSKNLFYISKWEKKVLFKNIDWWSNSSLSYKITEDKELTYQLLWLNNLPIPKSIYLNKKQDFDINNIWINFPLVVKPVDWSHWDGVTVNINSIDLLISAMENAFSFSNTIIIQNYVSWDDYRLIVVGNEIVAVAKRLPPSILWNSSNTIKELIDIENQNPLRWDWGYNKPLSNIEIDNELINCISIQGFDLDTILEKNKRIFLRKNANLSTWWTSIDYTDLVNPVLRDMVINAAKIVNLQVAWVDIITTDISKTFEESWWVFIEINATPWLRMHHFPWQWEPRNVAKKIIELYFN